MVAQIADVVGGSTRSASVVALLVTTLAPPEGEKGARWPQRVLVVTLRQALPLLLGSRMHSYARR